MKDKIKNLLGNLKIDDDADLFSKGILDSFGMLMFISKLENEFNIKFDNDELIPQNFWSVNAINELLRKKEK